MLPANRAMALLKTGQAAAAEADCTLAIRWDLIEKIIVIFSTEHLKREFLTKIESW